MISDSLTATGPWIEYRALMRNPGTASGLPLIECSITMPQEDEKYLIGSMLEDMIRRAGLGYGTVANGRYAHWIDGSYLAQIVRMGPVGGEWEHGAGI